MTEQQPTFADVRYELARAARMFVASQMSGAANLLLRANLISVETSLRILMRSRDVLHRDDREHDKVGADAQRMYWRIQAKKIVDGS